MKNQWASNTSEICSIFDFEEHRKSVAAEKSSRKSTRVMIEVACNEPVGADIKSCLGKHLEELGHVVLADQRPDWVFSIIAFSHTNLIELSVVLRHFFRSTRPGTEIVKAEGADHEMLREGGWVYESMKFHGLYGVPDQDLEGFLGFLAKEFGRQHAGPLKAKKRQP